MAWSGRVDEIEKRKRLIAADQSLGLKWSVVESLPVHERIRIGEGDLSEFFDNYRQSIRNLAACDIRTVCYNFMPVIDWTRTQLDHALPGGGTALRFESRCSPASIASCSSAKAPRPIIAPAVVAKGKEWFDRSSQSDRDKLSRTSWPACPALTTVSIFPACR